MLISLSFLNKDSQCSTNDSTDDSIIKLSRSAFRLGYPTVGALVKGPAEVVQICRVSNLREIGPSGFVVDSTIGGRIEPQRTQGTRSSAEKRGAPSNPFNTYELLSNEGDASSMVESRF